MKSLQFIRNLNVNLYIIHKKIIIFLLDNSLGYLQLISFFKFLLYVYPVSLLVQKETNHKISENTDNLCEWPPKAQNLL